MSFRNNHRDYFLCIVRLSSRTSYTGTELSLIQNAAVTCSYTRTVAAMSALKIYLNSPGESHTSRGIAVLYLSPESSRDVHTYNQAVRSFNRGRWRGTKSP